MLASYRQSIQLIYVASRGQPEKTASRNVDSFNFRFTVEYLLRFAGSPKKFSFLQQTMNVIDIMAIAPYYISLGR